MVMMTIMVMMIMMMSEGDVGVEDKAIEDRRQLDRWFAHGSQRRAAILQYYNAAIWQYYNTAILQCLQYCIWHMAIQC